ncbi:MAG: sodium:solute symporter family protein, partial [Bacteroidota bacterium]
MTLSTLDWTIIAAFFAMSLIIGIVSSKKAGSSVSEFFLSGRNMPWWLLGVSMVATTFSADTPNLVTDLVRNDGVAGNWGWWAFLLTGMLTVFVYAKLWRRSGVLTDVEFYELRYSGKPATFLRGFRALYLGLIFNVVVMGAVSLAAVKFGEIMLGIPGWLTLTIAGSITLIYSTLGGLKAVIITDFIQFIFAMIGSIWACIYLVNLPEVGGLSALLANEVVQTKTNILPSFTDPDVWIPVLIVPLAVQWWASYYPGSEPGGGGYIAQRMFSAKNERHAIGATFLYNVAHYALRPWPWILIALASLVVFPELSDIQTAFPNLPEDKLGDDVAYPAMLTFLPSGLLGLVAASLIAAFMSTMSTQLNLGASYLVNDFYQRFIKPEASEKELVWAGRYFTIISTFLGLGLGLLLTSAGQAFQLLLLLGAGTGLIYILRWFWWRINAMTEIVAMISSLIIASYFTFFHDKL